MDFLVHYLIHCDMQTINNNLSTSFYHVSAWFLLINVLKRQKIDIKIDK